MALPRHSWRLGSAWRAPFLLIVSLTTSACSGVGGPRATPAPVASVPSHAPEPTASTGAPAQTPLPEAPPKVVPPVVPKQAPVAEVSPEQVQRALSSLRAAGYWNGPSTLATAESLSGPLRRFQADAGLPKTGRLDAETLHRLDADGPSPGQTAGPSKTQPPGTTKPVAPSSTPGTEDPPLRKFSLRLGEEVWVLESHECKSADESWQTLYRGILRRVVSGYATVELRSRYGLWYDRRASGRSDEAWWCVPTHRYCSERIDFGKANGPFKPGDLASFPTDAVLPARFDVAALVSARFRRSCTESRKSASAAMEKADFPPELSTEIARLIEQHHYKRPTVGGCCKSRKALQKFLRRLDPYSRYLPASALAFAPTRDAHGVGLGLDLLPLKGRLLAVPLADGPAQRAGLARPVWLQRLNGVVVALDRPETYAYLADLLADTIVPLEVGEDGRTRSLRVQAADYRRPTMGYWEQAATTRIRLHQFRDGDDRRLGELLARAAARGTPLMLDLRFCPGGSLYAAVDAASLFLPPELPVVTLLAEQTPARTLVTLPAGEPLKVPLAVWVSPLTASAAEIFVRALVAHDPSIAVVGAPTAGKCLAQERFDLSDGGVLELSVANLEDARGRACQGIPIFPSHPVPAQALLEDSAYLVASAVKQKQSAYRAEPLARACKTCGKSR
jgi:carboxyl-terminal processing protease